MSLDQVVQSQLMMAQSFGALTNSLTASKTMQVSTRDVVATLTVPDAVTAISVGGVTTVGDGQAGLYTRVAADPGAVEKVQSADGSWFQLASPSSLATSGIISGSSVISTGTISGSSVTSTGTISAGSSIAAGLSIAAGSSISASTFIDAGTAFQIAGDQVLGPAIGGWATPTGTLSRATFTSTTVALTALAAHVAQLIIDLKTHGLLKT